MRFLYCTWEALADQLGVAGRALVVVAAGALALAGILKGIA